MTRNTPIISHNLHLLLFYIKFNGGIILEIKETEWKNIRKKWMKHLKIFVKIQEIRIDNFLESKIPSLIQYIYRRLQSYTNFIF